MPLISSFPWFCQATAPRFLAHTGFEEAFGQTGAGKGTFVPYLSLSVLSGVNTDPREEYRLGHRAGWWGMSGMWPRALRPTRAASLPISWLPPFSGSCRYLFSSSARWFFCRCSSHFLPTQSLNFVSASRIVVPHASNTARAITARMTKSSPTVNFKRYSTNFPTSACSAFTSRTIALWVREGKDARMPVFAPGLAPTEKPSQRTGCVFRRGA